MSTIIQTPPAIAAAREQTPGPRQIVPIHWWAAAGALILTFEAYVLVAWITGPHFQRVPTGPSEPPDWMKAVLTSWQAITIPLILAFLGWFLVRPWLKRRQLETDGLLCIAFLALSWQDPFSAYFGHWFTYNSYLFNRGSWVYEIPGWLSFGQPGQELASPLIVFTGLYVYVFLLLSILGTYVMRRARARWPRLGPVGLVLICWGVMSTACLVVEGLVYMPLGFYSYTGGHLNLIGAGTYHQVPLAEVIVFGALFTSMSALRYFRNDRGETFAERGLGGLRASNRRAGVLRLLALCGFVQVAMFFSYNVPSMLVGAHSAEWPRDVQTRSYFNNGICGAGTPRPCPGQGVPLLQDTRLGGSIVQLGADGVPRLTGPQPVIPPLDRGLPGAGK